MTRHIASIEAHLVHTHEQLLELHLMLAEAMGYKDSLPPKSIDSDVLVKTSGYSDPTASYALDPDRMKLNAAIEAACRALTEAESDLLGATRGLYSAVKPWRQ